MEYVKRLRNGDELYTERGAYYIQVGNELLEVNQHGEPILEPIEFDRRGQEIAWDDNLGNIYVLDNRGNIVQEEPAYEAPVVRQGIQSRNNKASAGVGGTKFRSQKKYKDSGRELPAAAKAPTSRSRAVVDDTELPVRRTNGSTNKPVSLYSYEPSPDSALVPLVDERYTKVVIAVNVENKTYKFKGVHSER